VITVWFDYLTLTLFRLTALMNCLLGTLTSISCHASVCLGWGKNINDSDGECYHRATSRILEELLHGIASMQTLFLT
jgi:hypothetical protein